MSGPMLVIQGLLAGFVIVIWISRKITDRGNSK